MDFLKNGRLPSKIRSSKKAALMFLVDIEQEFRRVDVTNPDIYTLANWCEYPFFGNELHTSNVSIVKSIKSGKTISTYDFSVPGAHNYNASSVICHNTCNLPEDATPENVREIYESAWESGCKGFTVYREGSRSGVLIDKSKQKDSTKFTSQSAPKRPDVLKCDIHHASIQGERWTILVGLYDKKPYELLGGLSELIEIPKKYRSGYIVKHPRKTMNSIYDLHFGENGDEVIIKNLVKVFNNPNYSSFTRVISLGLRHGAPVHYAVEQLQKDKDADMFSFSKVIARVLKNYIDDGTKSSERKCSNCGAEGTMVFQEGCVSCTACSSSKCG